MLVLAINQLEDEWNASFVGMNVHSPGRDGILYDALPGTGSASNKTDSSDLHIGNLLTLITQTIPRHWLRLVHPGLAPRGGALTRMPAGHDSVSVDRTLRSGSELE
jgi:hypothetical protein